MTPLYWMRRMPAPVKQLYAAWLVSFILGAVAIVIDADGLGRWAMVVMATLFAALGLAVALNLSGSADAMVEATKENKSLGVDYTESKVATPTFIRGFGVAVFIVGLVLLVTGLSNSPT